MARGSSVRSWRGNNLYKQTPSCCLPVGPPRTERPSRHFISNKLLFIVYLIFTIYYLLLYYFKRLAQPQAHRAPASQNAKETVKTVNSPLNCMVISLESITSFACGTTYILRACIERREEANKRHDEGCHVNIVPLAPFTCCSKFSERSQKVGEQSEVVQNTWRGDMRKR